MKRLRIGIDVNEANVKTRVGTGQYTFNILKQWYAHTEIEFHLYHRDPLQGDMPPESNHWQYHQVGPSKAWIRFGLPLYLASHKKNDIFWSPAHYMPKYIGSKSIVTIHDLAYEYFPDLFLPSDLYKLKNWTRSAVKQADHILSVSGATKQDLVKLYGVDQNKISVVHNGYDSDVFNQNVPADKAILNNYKIHPQGYILFLGTIQR
jgi:glycosyltransferase involved in cell wall biosynthesis